MSQRDWQYCTYCGEELIEKREPEFDQTRVSLVCPKKKYSTLSWRTIFKSDPHTEVFVDYIDTILNYDPITGERIKK